MIKVCHNFWILKKQSSILTEMTTKSFDQDFKHSHLLMALYGWCSSFPSFCRVTMAILLISSNILEVFLQKVCRSYNTLPPVAKLLSSSQSVALWLFPSMVEKLHQTQLMSPLPPFPIWRYWLVLIHFKSRQIFRSDLQTKFILSYSTVCFPFFFLLFFF